MLFKKIIIFDMRKIKKKKKIYYNLVINWDVEFFLMVKYSSIYSIFWILFIFGFAVSNVCMIVIVRVVLDLEM